MGMGRQNVSRPGRCSGPIGAACSQLSRKDQRDIVATVRCLPGIRLFRKRHRADKAAKQRPQPAATRQKAGQETIRANHRDRGQPSGALIRPAQLMGCMKVGGTGFADKHQCRIKITGFSSAAVPDCQPEFSRRLHRQPLTAVQRASFASMAAMRSAVLGWLSNHAGVPAARLPVSRSSF